VLTDDTDDVVGGGGMYELVLTDDTDDVVGGGGM
jgi:hypothetical protein